MRNVLIEPILNGFIVTVGCSKVCFTDIDTLCAELKRYQADPDVVERAYQEMAMNKSASTPLICYPEQIAIRPGSREFGISAPGLSSISQREVEDGI